MEQTKLYKVLNADGTGVYSGVTWDLPQNGKPGKWMPYLKGKLYSCIYGYHACRPQDLPEWLGERIWELEPRGRVYPDGNKVILHQARLIRKCEWDERVARLFMADCAEHVLHLFESKYPEDKRPRKAIQAARQFANGKIDGRQASAAASAAESAAESAANSAAWSAANSAAWSAAESAAESAANSAAWSAAWSAARGAARSAACSAARSAAESAAESAARSAARSAANSAAWSAANSAAWSAERQWQTERLIAYVEGRAPAGGERWNSEEIGMASLTQVRLTN